MADMVILKGANGGAVLVNLDNVLYVDTMNTEKGPAIGLSAIIFLGARIEGKNFEGIQLCVQGTPQDINEVVERQKRTIEIAQ